MELQAEYGNQWTKIGRSLEIPWQAIRYRYMMLKQTKANHILSARPPEIHGISELEVPAFLADNNIFLSNVCGIQFWSQRSLNEHDEAVREAGHKSETTWILYFVVKLSKCCHLRATRPFSTSSTSELCTVATKNRWDTVGRFRIANWLFSQSIGHFSVFWKI